MNPESPDGINAEDQEIRDNGVAERRGCNSTLRKIALVLLVMVIALSSPCFLQMLPLGSNGKYYLGLLSFNDQVTRAKYFKESAERGYDEAQFKLGFIYYKGNGFPKDYFRAFVWWEKAANQNHTKAQSRLGTAYLYGTGVEPNPIEAYIWYNLAAAAGDEEAEKARDAIELSPPEKEKAMKLSSEKHKEINTSAK